MTLKRKRSEPELCSSPSSVLSSPPSLGGRPVPPHAFFNMPPAHLNSRTFKRSRDNRPPEEQVHQHTLDLLYSAQQRHHQHTRRDARAPSPSPSPLPLPPDRARAHPHAPSRQGSLHSFWDIASSPAAGPSCLLAERSGPCLPCLVAPASCEDCGAGLDGAEPESLPCGACGKCVCFSCSVSDLGERKRCLQCAGRKPWTGGFGCAGAGVSIC
ncbi:uncharacterized protein UV8b_01593 [Ustilaginoidea virens]|uniref:Uncharacterized protein n=1 Tax=Ustilaginoidea virens TaxID=1159556 RepID=A0A8E5HL85_USTVR|nr:uncharacterized protein UV8b_01593 [Ustilaginoidea virens]QUC17352.1 hypothetical protein UV8b_01593 [Ustilaginoidea virens]